MDKIFPLIGMFFTIIISLGGFILALKKYRNDDRNDRKKEMAELRDKIDDKAPKSYVDCWVEELKTEIKEKVSERTFLEFLKRFDDTSSTMNKKLDIIDQRVFELPRTINEAKNKKS
jgi:hypothetical protein